MPASSLDAGSMSELVRRRRQMRAGALYATRSGCICATCLSLSKLSQTDEDGKFTVELTENGDYVKVRSDVQ